MGRFVEQADRGQSALLPDCLDDFIDESNPVRAIDAFVDALNLVEMGFEGVEPAATGHRRRALQRGHDRGPSSDRRAMRAFQTITQKFIPPA